MKLSRCAVVPLIHVPIALAGRTPHRYHCGCHLFNVDVLSVSWARGVLWSDASGTTQQTIGSAVGDWVGEDILGNMTGLGNSDTKASGLQLGSSVDVG